MFDPEDDEASQEEYRTVFRDYKNIVDKLLESHMKELMISAAQFETACQEAEGVLSAKFHHALFEQIWAADDFDAFKRMMIQINIDLQLWALEILAARFGIIPASFIPEGTSTEEFFGEDDDFFLREAKRRSMIDSIDVMKLNSQRKPSKGQVMEVEVSVNEEPSDSNPSPNAVQETLPEAKGRPTEAKKELKKVYRREEVYDDDQEYPAIGIKEVVVPKVVQETRVMSPRHPGRKLPSMKKDMDPEEIKHRQAYLQRQRDKLLGLKKQEREKQLARIQDLERSGKRPQTAKFMEAEHNALEESDKDDKKSLAYMRSLAARIKAEVADSDDDDDQAEGKEK